MKKIILYMMLTSCLLSGILEQSIGSEECGIAYISGYGMLHDIESDTWLADDPDTKSANKSIDKNTESDYSYISFNFVVVDSREVIRGLEHSLDDIRIVNSEGNVCPIKWKYDDHFGYSGSREQVRYSGSLMIEGTLPYTELEIEGIMEFELFDYQKDSIECKLKDHVGKSIQTEDGECRVDLETKGSESIIRLRLDKNSDGLCFSLKNEKSLGSDTKWISVPDEKYQIWEYKLPSAKVDEAILVLQLKMNERRISIPIRGTINVGLKYS